MRKFLSLTAVVIFFSFSTIHITYASEKYFSFPLNDIFSTGGLSGGGMSISTSCVVNKNDEDELYSYIITVDYETDKRMLLSWNFLDWILSQYPNAMSEPPYASANLFPLNVGKGNYTFRFKSAEAPLWFRNTLIQIFPYEMPDARELEYNKEIAEEWSGVSVSSYNYINTDLGLAVSACLPSHLLVFPNSTRSGF